MTRTLVLALSSVACAAACTPTQGPVTPLPNKPAPALVGEPWEAKLDVGHPLVGRIFSPVTGAFVTADVMMDSLAGAKVVLLGEKHDAPDHHRLQAAVIHALVLRTVRPAVAFEMIEAEQQSKVDEAISTSPGDPDVIGDAVAWQTSGWPPFSLYRPLFVEVRSHWLPVLGAGVSRTRLQGWVGKDAPPLPPELRAQHHLDDALPEQASLEAELLASHCGALPKTAVGRMVLAQRIRDSVMAQTVADKEHAVLIAGAGHVRNDRGVPWALSRIKPGTTTRSLAFVEVEGALQEPKAYAAVFHAKALPFDFVWFTPRLDDEDPCKPKS
ncbi:MAG: ChaN family lipoprotein [Myxococcales bacterium]|nr:ChaN family lipoprotein [Myxococcales bacterium]